jgi:hypothetical protein
MIINNTIHLLILVPRKGLASYMHNNVENETYSGLPVVSSVMEAWSRSHIVIICTNLSTPTLFIMPYFIIF